MKYPTFMLNTFLETIQNDVVVVLSCFRVPVFNISREYLSEGFLGFADKP